MDLKQSEVTEAKSSIEEPPELELKDLPSHLEYAYLEENDKLPVIIAKGLKDDEKDALLKVLKSHKRAIAWKITDIKAVDYLSKWVEAKALPTNDARVVVKFLKSLFAPDNRKHLDAIISDRGPIFVMIISKVMSSILGQTSSWLHQIFSVTLNTLKRAESSGRYPIVGLNKRTQKGTVREKPRSWSDKLDDTLWAFRTAFKTPIGYTPYKLVYGKVLIAIYL
ncbi:reverse transcriptase domain-containing protein [Tanacetum coccineum]